MAVFTFLILIIKFVELYGHKYDDVLVTIQPPISLLQLAVHDTLNLTCSLSLAHNTYADIHLEWAVPTNNVNRQNIIDTQQTSLNSLNMVIKNLQESDSGEYKCTASSNTNPDIQLEKTIRINVKRKRVCSEVMFRCQRDICIPKRFTCDGKEDCSNGEDESVSLCGLNACKNKIMCEGRCVPSSWCCDPQHQNCTGPRHHCCYHIRSADEHQVVDSYLSQRYNDAAFFQTTVYTVIGCAMAFMLIVTILVIAICRVHMRRTLMPGRCHSAADSTGHNYPLPFHDIDYLFPRPPTNPLMVTYNINNGVQFVGRPVDPPPYCETVATPPREGPPPPYVSTENLVRSRRDEDEPQETDALLHPVEQPITVILARSSSNVSQTESEDAVLPRAESSADITTDPTPNECASVTVVFSATNDIVRG